MLKYYMNVIFETTKGIRTNIQNISRSSLNKFYGLHNILYHMTGDI